jgi:hypothetical protein
MRLSLDLPCGARNGQLRHKLCGNDHEPHV